MKASHLDMQLRLIGFSPRQSLGDIADRVKGLLTKDRSYQNRLSYWQTVFLQSKVNGCLYHGEDLPHSNWRWPKKTWFQERLSGHAREFDRHREALLNRPIDPLRN